MKTKLLLALMVFALAGIGSCSEPTEKEQQSLPQVPKAQPPKNAYDHQAGRYAEPGQGAWMTHPVYGEFDYISFNLLTA